MYCNEKYQKLCDQHLIICKTNKIKKNALFTLCVVKVTKSGVIFTTSHIEYPMIYKQIGTSTKYPRRLKA